MAADHVLMPPRVGPGMALAKRDGLFKRIARFALGPDAIEPRKGAAQASISPTGQGLTVPKGQSAVLMQREYRLTSPGYTLLDLANRDDIIFSIRRTLREGIGDLKWQIAPKLEKMKADINRWNIVTQVNEVHPEWGLKFIPQVIPPEFFLNATGSLREVLLSERQAGNDITTSSRLRQFFLNVLEYFEAIAKSHILTVQDAFESPNPSAESSFRTLLDQIVDELSLNDACALIKNPRVNGAWGEMYTIPGGDVRIYRNPSRSTPQPPYVAYDWYENGIIKAFYNNLEMVYMYQNLQPDGYGRSPMESIIQQMIGSILGDNYLVDFFSNNNFPAGVFDMGPNINQYDRDAMEAAWDQRMRKGLHRIMFIGNKDGVKGFLPLQQPSNKDQDVLMIMQKWAARKCAVYGLSLSDIGFTEDLQRESGLDAQNKIMQSRGINAMAKRVAGYLQAEVVDGKMWVRRDPMDPNNLDGQPFRCFPFNDVEFQFVYDEKEQSIEDAQRSVALVDAGIMSRNEVRDELGEPPIEGGDIFFMTSSKILVKDLPEFKSATAQDGKNGPGGPGDGEGGEDGDEGGEGGDLGAKPPKPPQPTKPKPPNPSVRGDEGERAEKRLERFADRIAKMALAPRE